ncbi:hypothetical protein QUF74_04850 [Candidatus Halobeggiatoa sp. HSG11]|nr:hypothetical protein [Candidatus Halobeggiatoa sp. HSG11]
MSINAKYYEDNDFADVLHNSETKKVYRPKRITMNISKEIYDEAHVLDEFMNMGYQNVLKAAMTLGLEQLHKSVKCKL